MKAREDIARELESFKRPIAPDSEGEQWLYKDKSASILGISERAFERLVQYGRIEKRMIPRKGSEPARACFKASDIERLKVDRENPVPNGTSSAVVQRSNQPLRPPSLTELQYHPLLQLNPSVRAEAVKHDKPWLTIQEASSYSGLPVHWLRKKCKEGSLGINVAGARRPQYRIKRSDLDGEAF